MKKTSKIIIAVMIVLAMTLMYFSPLVDVVAETYGSGEYHMNLELNNGEFEIDSVKVNDHTWTSVDDEFRSDNNTFVIKIWVYNYQDKHPNISYCGGECGSHFNVDVYPASNGGIYVYTITVTDFDQSFVALDIVDGPSIEEMNDANESHFDGKAYVLWSCGNGTCYHYFDNIPNFDDGNSTFYKDTTIKADNNESISFDVDATYKAWALPEKFNRWKEAYKEQHNIDNINWAQVDPEDIISENPPHMEEWEALAEADYQNDHETGCHRPGENAPREDWGQFQNCVDEYYIAAGNLPFIRLQPVGEPQYKNAYVSYGDRNFKVVIYNSNYKGVAMGILSTLHYYPSSWTNPFIKRDQFDIGGTTKENPTGIDSILLESTVNIKALNPNGFEIKSIEALDVPEDAVAINKNNGEFSLVFASNFYDNVIFKVTDTHDEVSYMQINRYTVDGYFKYNRNNKPVVAAEFYFDRTKDYDDFDLTLKILYKDGTTKSVVMNAIDGIDDGLGNINPGYELDEETIQNGPRGKGLKQSYFEYELENDEINTIDKMYINAEYTGSTSSNYAGAYVGSGEGVPVKVYRGE